VSPNHGLSSSVPCHPRTETGERDQGGSGSSLAKLLAGLACASAVSLAGWGLHTAGDNAQEIGELRVEVKATTLAIHGMQSTVDDLRVQCARIATELDLQRRQQR
jgi:hypothetical protein